MCLAIVGKDEQLVAQTLLRDLDANSCRRQSDARTRLVRRARRQVPIARTGGTEASQTRCRLALGAKAPSSAFEKRAKWTTLPLPSNPLPVEDLVLGEDG